MKDDDQSTDAWLDKLDVIATGGHMTSADDDELLPVATQLARALAPLRIIDGAAEIRRQRTLSRLRARHNGLASKSKRHLSRSAALVAALLLCVLAIEMMGSGWMATMWGSALQIWHASTSLDQIRGVSVAALSHPRAGVRPLPLLPTVVIGYMHASTYGVITEPSHPDIMTTFVADYRISGQDVWLYEQPSAVPFSSSAAQKVHIGTLEGQWFQDDAGNHALQWYQHGMMCQITSKLPAQNLLALASTFEPIESWDLLL
ncbi:MAG: hypothetical protein ACJ788_17325 [Ktedonobacteraceae bacterium]